MDNRRIIETDAVSGLYVERLLDSAIDCISSLEETEFTLEGMKENRIKITVKVIAERVEDK